MVRPGHQRFSMRKSKCNFLHPAKIDQFCRRIDHFFVCVPALIGKQLPGTDIAYMKDHIAGFSAFWHAPGLPENVSRYSCDRVLRKSLSLFQRIRILCSTSPVFHSRNPARNQNIADVRQPRIVLVKKSSLPPSHGSSSNPSIPRFPANEIASASS